MLLDPHNLENDLERVEDIEKASLRLVVQALFDFREAAWHIFEAESDLVADIGEDITREALDRMGMSRIEQRLFGKIDYKRARYIFHPEYAIKQALFVDSKAEKVSGQNTATLQTSQFSMRVRQIRSGEPIDIPGKLPFILDVGKDSFLTTTVFVKYNYEEPAGQQAKNTLQSITIAALPNGLLQPRYNPTCSETIWLLGRNAPTLGEEFRVRLSFPRLKGRMGWRVQFIPMAPEAYSWDE
jgi:hypothetical protein